MCLMHPHVVTLEMPRIVRWIASGVLAGNESLDLSAAKAFIRRHVRPVPFAPAARPDDA